MMYALEPRMEFKKYLESTDSKNTYDFRHKPIGCFDKNLMEMFFKNIYNQTMLVKEECVLLFSI